MTFEDTKPTGRSQGSADFRAASGKPANENKRDRRNKGGNDKDTGSKIDKNQLIATIKNRLPAIGSTSFKMGDENIVATENQKKLVQLEETKTVVMVKGPIGSGKTFWTCKTALEGLVEGRYRTIALTAPAVEADEELGFLPGNANEKMHMHVLQLLEAIEDLVGKKVCQDLIDSEMLIIAPHAYNRGRTYKKTFYILDESQNASGRQLMTSLGRLGFGSTFVYMGDDKQNDRTTSTSAYVAFTERFNKAVYAEEIGSVTLTKDDVRRHSLLQKIVANGDDKPLDGYESRQDSRINRGPNQG
jgi:phosphate starvation-inducible PhoH-like protein